MPITIDMESHVLFQEGEKKGIERGIERGIQKGVKGDIVKLYTKGNMSIETIAGVLELDIEFVKNTLRDNDIEEDELSD